MPNHIMTNQGSMRNGPTGEAAYRCRGVFGDWSSLEGKHSVSPFKHISSLLIVALISLSAPIHAAESILTSKHDLSVTSPNSIKAVTESEVCIFCHTPHQAGETPLWNHTLSAATYTPYSSSTTKASIGQPTGASKLCLSCHDGTVALGMINSRSSALQMQSGVTTLPTGHSNLGTDLSDDHPISFTYDGPLTSANGQLK